MKMLDISNGSQKALLFGRVPHKYLKNCRITSDLDLIAQRLGVLFEQIPMDELTSRCDSLNEEDLRKHPPKLPQQAVRAGEGLSVCIRL